MKLYLNRPDLYNDICEEIRLFLPRASIALYDERTGEAMDKSGIFGEERFSFDEGGTLHASVVHDGVLFTAHAAFVYNGKDFSYTHTTPCRGGSDLIEKRYAKRCIKAAVFRTMRQAFPQSNIPWGSLTGIRPTRLLRELIDTEGYDEAVRLMRDEFDVEPSKLSLADTIVSVQRPVIASAKSNEFDVYVGIPFCRTRCLYCSFASELRTKKTDMSAYLKALMRDIALGSSMTKQLGMRPRALYFGGGTPTILTADEMTELLDRVCECYDTAGLEFTVEAGRPDTITEEKLRVLKAHGVNRVSVNPQTMCAGTLHLVGRDHTPEDFKRCFNTVREVGFDSVNCDVIAGLPNEKQSDMAHTLDEIAILRPDCLTVHTLAIKRSSRLHEHMDEYDMPNVGCVEDMVALGADAASKMGMQPYYMYRQKYMAGNLENVGYSTPQSICVYNIDMMEDSLSIIAHGAGAMTKRVFNEGGRIDRVPNPKDIETYINKLEVTDAERRRLFAGE